MIREGNDILYKKLAEINNKDIEKNTASQFCGLAQDEEAGDMQLNATAQMENDQDKNGLVFINYTEFIDPDQIEKNA